MSPTTLVAYLALFFGAGALFLFVNLLVGRFLRPKLPNEEKLEIYECGEPTIGSSFVQFDLRFYVVALLFLIFDVEVAFFFPWATVYGKTNALRDARLSGEAFQTSAPALLEELGIPADAAQTAVASGNLPETADTLAWLSFGDILVFFGVVMVGFFYVWKRGDIDWVRAVSRERALQTPRPPPEPQTSEEQMALAP